MRQLDFQRSNEKLVRELLNDLETQKPVRCTYTDPYKGIDLKGTIYYMDERNQRTDFQGFFSTDDTLIEAHMLRDGESEYTWDSRDVGNKGRGIKKSIRSISVESFGGAFGNDAEYHCEPWVVDKSKFIPPSDIKFEDVER